ncbi:MULTISPECIES: hypothetical protein [Protofrankia]|uniref:Uncharacterized protein n=1 Tax=Candidatus Protofrankia datiscae TaxID=2716812 RepID=F8AWK1_9ACTN|nr:MULTISPECIES: hypothetical protein [Protofrankia]AEH09338.1 hypothetical protein FsymDg_1900 [Candidatus Protofrankia datiscae]
MSQLTITDRQRAALRELAVFPLLAGIHGRRSRRFPVGGEIPAGPLAFRSGRPAQWVLPNPTGLPGVFETLSRPLSTHAHHQNTWH